MNKLSESIFETYSAFANTEGGDIYPGISVAKLAEEIDEPLSSVKMDVKELILLRQARDNGKARKGRLIFLNS